MSQLRWTSPSSVAMMRTTRSDQGFKPDPVRIKQEPGVHIKSEFEPSLASLPLAPAPNYKKEAIEDKKSALDSIPQKRGRGGRSRRRHFGDSMVLRMKGYHFRAHYGHGKVDFTVTKDGHGTGILRWEEVEREMFRKFHHARFFIEPTDTSGALSLSSYLLHGGSRPLRFSIGVRNIHPRPSQAAPSTGTRPVVSPSTHKTERREQERGLFSSSSPILQTPHNAIVKKERNVFLNRNPSLLGAPEKDEVKKDKAEMSDRGQTRAEASLMTDMEEKKVLFDMSPPTLGALLKVEKRGLFDWTPPALSAPQKEEVKEKNVLSNCGPQTPGAPLNSEISHEKGLLDRRPSIFEGPQQASGKTKKGLFDWTPPTLGLSAVTDWKDKNVVFDERPSIPEAPQRTAVKETKGLFDWSPPMPGAPQVTDQKDKKGLFDWSPPTL